MEDDKLAAYYDELTRKGGGAARFKQGLGFSTTSSTVPTTQSSSSSFLSSFVRSSSPTKTNKFEKEAQLQSIKNKLTKKPQNPRNTSPDGNSGRVRDGFSSRSRSRSRERRKSYRSRSRSSSRERRKSYQSRSGSKSRERCKSYRSRSRSRERDRDSRKKEYSKKGGTDFAKLIDGYEDMTPAERVKAKMKVQLSKTAENDETIGKGSGWERFDFDKDAPLDDEEIEAVEDDAALVKHIGQSFRFSSVTARKEEEIKSAHDEAMFGTSSLPPPTESDEEPEDKSSVKQNAESAPVTNLLSNQILTMQKGSWRDRARKT